MNIGTHIKRIYKPIPVPNWPHKKKHTSIPAPNWPTKKRERVPVKGS